MLFNGHLLYIVEMSIVDDDDDEDQLIQGNWFATTCAGKIFNGHLLYKVGVDG